VLNIIKPGCLGEEHDFIREWAGDHYGKTVIIKNPQALGTYLREQFLFLRRTRSDVGMELPRINTIIQNIDYDEESLQKFEQIAKVLAIKVTQGSFMERGQAARELDMLARQSTGVAKAKGVAAFVRMLLESGEPVLLGGWHREVYDIWQEELSDFNPVFYTGAESAKQKSESEARFVSGETNLMIMSLRSGIGVDGLQNRCSTVVYGEFDWSPKVHDQFTGRIDRPGQPDPVTVYFLTSDAGSDPLIIDLLGLKASQSAAIIDPMQVMTDQHSDESRIKLLAQQYLSKEELFKSELF
jgi:SNF2 family DNA or RNA helicase